MGEPDAEGQPRLVAEVTEFTPDVLDAAGGSASGMGRGGMSSKVNAARIATRAGCRVVMARGKPAHADPPVLAVVHGETLGTVFQPAERALKGRKRWLAASAPVEGTLTVDDGAAAALLRGGKSLLAVGVRGIEGDFGPGDLVLVADAGGTEIARGLVSYGADDVRRMCGLHGHELAAALGYEASPEVVHRDNLATTGAAQESNDE